MKGYKFKLYSGGYLITENIDKLYWKGIGNNDREDYMLYICVNDEHYKLSETNNFYMIGNLYDIAHEYRIPDGSIPISHYFDENGFLDLTKGLKE